MAIGAFGMWKCWGNSWNKLLIVYINILYDQWNEQCLSIRENMKLASQTLHKVYCEIDIAKSSRN